MTNRSKAKGTAWETEIVTVLHEDGIESARRVVLAGSADVGDVHVGAILSPLVVIEAKNEKALTFSSYVDEANREADNAGALFGGVAWVKRRGKASARHGYVVMDGATFIEMLHAISTKVERDGAPTARAHRMQALTDAMAKYDLPTVASLELADCEHCQATIDALAGDDEDTTEKETEQ